LAYADPLGKSQAIYFAYLDIVNGDFKAMCAERKDPDALKTITEFWINDSQSASAWRRATQGD
jgi:hypothetical protein